MNGAFAQQKITSRKSTCRGGACSSRLLVMRISWRTTTGFPENLCDFWGFTTAGFPENPCDFRGFTSNGRPYLANEFYVRFALTHLLYSSVSKADTFPAREGKTQLKISSACTIHDLVSIHVQRTIYDAQASIHVACDNSSKNGEVALSIFVYFYASI